VTNKKVVGITGSMRKESSSEILLKDIANGVEQTGAEFTLINIADYDIKPVDVSTDEAPLLCT
jgi:multimeric flavodoxin WrbA